VPATPGTAGEAFGIARDLGREYTAMDLKHSTMRPRRTATRRLAVLGAFALMALSAQLMLAAPAGAISANEGFSPTIVSQLADLNGDGVVDGADDSIAFYGDTDIINGALDCDAWVAANDGAAGDGLIDGGDDCTLIGYDGTGDGVTITVTNGLFIVADGPLPTVFNAGDPANPDVGDSDFAWSTIDGRVDSNGNERIGGGDCHFDVIAGVDILGNPGANECGFATAPDPAFNGLVDLNQDQDITSADSCDDGCFFGHDVTLGRVQATVCPGYEGDSRNQVIGTSGPDTLVGTSGRDIICGFAGRDTITGRGGRDVLLGGRAADDIKGGRNADTLRGGPGNDHLNGGPGRDDCAGGPGTDTLVHCET
jgi:Ca2+-binding RTX toxin-like protein